MIIAGLDFSITCPTICIHDITNDLKHSAVKFYFNQYNPTKKEYTRWEANQFRFENIFCSRQNEYTDNIHRFYYLSDWVSCILKENNVSTLILENYALGAKGKVFNIAEATGITKLHVKMLGINIVTIEPTKNKKIFSNYGNANKEKMIMTYNEMNNVNISEIFSSKKDLTGSPVSDIVDSFSLIYSYLKEYINYGNTTIY